MSGAKVLKLPVKLKLGNMPVGQDGLFDWIVAVKKGQPALIEVPPLEEADFAELSRVFKTLHQAAELAAATTRLSSGRDLAAAMVDPLEEAARLGSARLCTECGSIWDRRSHSTAEGGGQGTCDCGAAYHVGEARAEAARALGVDLQPKKSKPQPAINEWF